MRSQAGNQHMIAKCKYEEEAQETQTMHMLQRDLQHSSAALVREHFLFPTQRIAIA